MKACCCIQCITGRMGGIMCRRAGVCRAVKRAMAAGKHVYCEKPVATSTAEALELYRLAKAAGIKHGVVQDKLWLPGFVKLKMLKDTGFFWKNFVSARGIWVLGV